MTMVKMIITYCLFPAVFFATQCVGFWAINTEQNYDLVFVGVLLGTVVLVALGERINPFYDDWNQSQNDVSTDFTHAVISMGILPKVLEAGLGLGLVAAALRLSEYVGRDLWPSDWPLVLQLVLALVVSQFAEYWVHRGMHEVPWLWRLHATHHSPKRLYWLNAARFHPLDTAMGYIAATAPLLVLGAGPQILFLYSLWVFVHGMFQHCNIDLKLGPLNYVFSMAELHRWHHSLKLEEANSNYGNNIILWDLVFKTFYWPRQRVPSRFIGLAELPLFPQSYWGQIMSPFRWERVSSKLVSDD